MSVIVGRVSKGIGIATTDMRHPQFKGEEWLGYKPVDGTLNLKVEEGSLKALSYPDKILNFAGLEWWLWEATLYSSGLEWSGPCTLMHPNKQPHDLEDALKIEIIAPIHVRSTLRISDEHEVTIKNDGTHIHVEL